MKQILKALPIVAVLTCFFPDIVLGQAVTNVPCNQLPALTGPVTTSAGSCATAVVAPQVSVFTSGIAQTYTTPANAKYLIIEMVGGGGGGAASGTAPGAASAGGNTTFGTALLVANGGTAGSTSAGTGSAGGTATGGDINLTGGPGGTGSNQVTTLGGHGGTSYFGGSGPGGFATNAPGAASANTGSGGGGNGPNATAPGGGGGGAGGYCRKLITSPLSTYAYTVGTAGVGGTLGTGGGAGANGAAGLISVTAYFQ